MHGHSHRRILALLLVFAVAAGAACSPKKVVKGDAAPGTSDRDEAKDRFRSRDGEMWEDPSVNGGDVPELEFRKKQFAESPDLAVVQFDYDMYELSREARLALRDNASYLKAHPDLDVLVEGHCDDRGTGEYNLALGQKRAKAVRDYYMRLGVPGRSIGTISFGEEMPVCRDENDACWRRNRRGVTKINAQVSSNGFNKHIDTR